LAVRKVISSEPVSQYVFYLISILIPDYLRSKGFGDALIDLEYSKVAMLDTGLKFISDFEVESKI
jgi:hypothetical protein